ncbi:uncharacterized protein LOC122397890 [Colletes gigas]|uniref:uncharacterized protein LOC122397890 n=1 Tax=Colletes gigas TaxID=935657 RepID=UPI001C9B028A|nr:uncharacterized protein LOC122397890 [Colletes gigas]
MNSRICNFLISFWLHLFFQWSGAITENSFPISKELLTYRTISTFRKYCTCPMIYSCSCCQTVIILRTKAEKNLCVNVAYQRNGLNFIVMLNSNSIQIRSVTDYKPFKFCVNVPGCFFSSACVNVLELNQFSRSITVCLRLDVLSKKRHWQMNYDCVSIATKQTTNGTEISFATSTTLKMTSALSSSQITTITTITTTTMTTKANTEGMTRDVEVLTVPESESTTIVDID